MTRAAMLEVFEQDYIRTARAYGIRQYIIIYLYALKNAISPTLTVIGLTFAFALTGTFFVEIIFNWPGLGLFTVRSLLNFGLSRHHGHDPLWRNGICNDQFDR